MPFSSSSLTGLFPQPLPCVPGGNAGLAATYAAKQLGLPIKVVVPGSTPSVMVERMRKEGAEVEVTGKVCVREGEGVCV